MSRNLLSLAEFVQVSESEELFEFLDNEAILELCQLGNTNAFRSSQQIERSTGVRLRRILQRDVTVVDVAMALCQKIEEKHSLNWQHCGAIGLCYSHIDSNAAQELACHLASYLAVPVDRFFTINGGCCGFLELLHQGEQKLQTNKVNGPVPLLCVETPETWHDASDRLFCGIVSAGAAGTILSSGGSGHRLLQLQHQHEYIPPEQRNGGEPLFQKRNDIVTTFRGAREQRTVMSMNAEAVFCSGIEAMLDESQAGMLAATKVRRVILPHQPSGKMLRAMVDISREQRGSTPMLIHLEVGGNMLSATIPTLLAKLDEVLAINNELPLLEGDQVIITAAGISMPQMSDHLSRGHALIEWRPTNSDQIKSEADNIAMDYVPTR